MIKNKVVFALIIIFAGYGVLSFISEVLSINNTAYNSQGIIESAAVDIPPTDAGISETPTIPYVQPTEEIPTTEATIEETQVQDVPAIATEPEMSISETQAVGYDFGYTTNADDVRYNSDYFTANAQSIKDNGLVEGQVNVTGQFTYAGHGYSVSDMSWYDSETMADLNAYYINDAYGEGQYIVLSAYDSKVFADQYVTVYGTVIDIDLNGVIYIAGQLIEGASVD